MITEETVKKVMMDILSEETSKVKREDFSRVQFKIEELENSIDEVKKGLRKLQDCVPDGLKTICDKRLSSISNHLNESEKTISSLKNKIKFYKKSLYNQTVEVKKKS